MINVGAVGHLNPASGYGEWPLALDLISYLDSPDHYHFRFDEC